MEERRNDKELVAVLDALLGTRQKQMDGTEKRLTDGVISRVERIEAQLSNGGVRIKLPWPAWSAIWIAIIAGVAQVVAAAIA